MQAAAKSQAQAPFVWIGWYRKRNLIRHPGTNKDIRKTDRSKQFLDTDQNQANGYRLRAEGFFLTRISRI
jgi:hypothetical protein